MVVGGPGRIQDGFAGRGSRPPRRALGQPVPVRGGAPGGRPRRQPELGVRLEGRRPCPQLHREFHANKTQEGAVSFPAELRVLRTSDHLQCADLLLDIHPSVLFVCVSGCACLFVSSRILFRSIVLFHIGV